MIRVPVLLLPHGEGLPLPDYATGHSAGADLLAAIEGELRLAPGERALDRPASPLPSPRDTRSRSVRAADWRSATASPASTRLERSTRTTGARSASSWSTSGREAFTCAGATGSRRWCWRPSRGLPGSRFRIFRPRSAARVGSGILVSPPPGGWPQEQSRQEAGAILQKVLITRAPWPAGVGDADPAVSAWHQRRRLRSRFTSHASRDAMLQEQSA